MPNRILVFIPAYNCENQIGRVFAKIDERVQALIEEVVVIDNRSEDGTVAAAIKAAASPFYATSRITIWVAPLSALSFTRSSTSMIT
jgi:glycosyltransferase involved in cell wall biosynthesis